VTYEDITFEVSQIKDTRGASVAPPYQSRCPDGIIGAPNNLYSILGCYGIIFLRGMQMEQWNNCGIIVKPSYEEKH
jgi:hypothetical protein